MPHSIKMVRRWATDNSTISEFSIEDANPDKGEIASGFILECPGPDTKERGLRKRIMEGTYSLKWRTTTDLKGVRPHLPVPWLHNSVVAEERYIYIHNGNYPRNTDGCLLIGRTRGKDFVGHSVDSLNKLKSYLNRVGIKSVTLTITSKYS